MDNGINGKIINLSANAVLVIENCSDPFAFIEGKLTEKEFNEVIAILKEYERPTIYCHPLYHPFLLKAGYDFHLRAEFSLNRDLLLPFKYDLNNIRIQKIENNEKNKLYNLKENFLKYNFGYALIVESQVISEAYVTVGRQWVELNIFTHSDFRRKGYAKLLLSHLIEKYLNKKIIPIWSCQVDNKASLYTALSLGFTIKRYYTLLVPKWGNVLCPNLAFWTQENNYP